MADGDGFFKRLLAKLTGTSAASAETVEQSEQLEVGLHVLSDYGETQTLISTTPNRNLIMATLRELDWRNGFHQVILVTSPGVSMEVGGSLDPSDGLSSVYRDEKSDVYRVTATPPGTVDDMVAILVSFLQNDGRWEQMYEYR